MSSLYGIARLLRNKKSLEVWCRSCTMSVLRTFFANVTVCRDSAISSETTSKRQPHILLSLRRKGIQLCCKTRIRRDEIILPRRALLAIKVELAPNSSSGLVGKSKRTKASRCSSTVIGRPARLVQASTKRAWATSSFEWDFWRDTQISS